MRTNTLLITALALCAAANAATAANPPTIEFDTLAPESNAEASHSVKNRAKVSPVRSEMVATLRPDGSVELRCAQHHDHSGDRVPDAERPR
jgi:hypothetical protein